MAPSDLLKTTMNDADSLPPKGTYSRRTCSINLWSFATAYDNKSTGIFRTT